MSTILIIILIIALVIASIMYYRKNNGTCGDCDCSCPVKDRMKEK